MWQTCDTAAVQLQACTDTVGQRACVVIMRPCVSGVSILLSVAAGDCKAPRVDDCCQYPSPAVIFCCCSHATVLQVACFQMCKQLEKGSSIRSAALCLGFGVSRPF